jgi:predicted nucleic acid-binding protein
MIVDASVAVKWVVYEDGSTEALDLLGRELAAPAIWLAEAANALRTNAPEASSARKRQPSSRSTWPTPR